MQHYKESRRKWRRYFWALECDVNHGIETTAAERRALHAIAQSDSSTLFWRCTLTTTQFCYVSINR
jgi:hypothetical protein